MFKKTQGMLRCRFNRKYPTFFPNLKHTCFWLGVDNGYTLYSICTVLIILTKQNHFSLAFESPETSQMKDKCICLSKRRGHFYNNWNTLEQFRFHGKMIMLYDEVNSVIYCIFSTPSYWMGDRFIYHLRLPRASKSCEIVEK